jgi:hypothetical protein
VTPAHAWRLFWSLPLVVQAWLALLALVVGAGVWALSRGAGRVAGRVGDRRGPDAAERVQRERGREIEFAGELDLDGDDLEEADRGRR